MCIQIQDNVICCIIIKIKLYDIELKVKRIIIYVFTHSLLFHDD